MMYSATSVLVLLACAYVDSHSLTPEQIAILSRTLEQDLPVAASNELNSLYDDISENELLKKYQFLERLKESARVAEPSYDLEQPIEVTMPRDRDMQKEMMQRESRRQQGPYMTLCHFKICNMGKKRSKLFPQH